MSSQQQRRANFRRPGKTGPRAGAPKAQPRRPPPQPTVAAGGRSRNGRRGQRYQRRMTGSVYCPDVFNDHIGLAVHKHTPYTVITERVVLPIATSAAEDKLILLGQITPTSTSSATRTNMVGCYGSSANLANGMTYIQSTKLDFTKYGGKSRIRLHRLSATVSCDGNAVGAVPPGHVFLGTLNSPIDMTGFTTIGDIITYLKTVNQVHGRTAKRCNDNPVKLVSYPIDRLDWSQFKSFGPAPNSPVSFDDTNAPIAIVIQRQPNPSLTPGDYTINWTITIHLEWCVIFSNDPILQASHTRHPVTSESTWDRATGALQQTAGFVSNAASQVGQVVDVVERGMGIAARMGL